MLTRINATLVIMAIIFVFTAASFFLSLSFTQRHMIDMTEQELSLALDIADNLVTTKMGLLKANTDIIAARLEAAPESEMMEVLEAQMEEFKDFVSLTVYDQLGLVVNCGEPVNHDAVLLESEFITAALSGKSLLSSAHYNNENGNFIIHAFVPIGSGRVLSATFPGLYFSDLLSEYRLWQTGSVFMVDAKGTFVASLRTDLVLGQRNLIEDAKTNPELKLASEFYKNLVANERASGGYSFEGQQRVCVCKRVSGSKSGWYIGVVAPLNESPIKSVQKGLLLSALLLLAIGALISVFVSGLVLKPFLVIQKQAAEIQAEHKLTSLLLDAMPFACTLWDKDLNIFECNEEAIRLFQPKDRRTFLDRFGDFSPKYQPNGQVSAEMVSVFLKKAFDGGRYVCEWVHQQLDGTPIPTEVTLVRIVHNGSNIVAGYVRDLREHKRMMAEIDRQYSLLKVGNRTAQILLTMENRKDMKTMLLDSMKLVGHSVDADRVQLWQNEMRDNRLHFVHAYQWCSDVGQQKTPVPLGLRFPYSDISHWEEMFLRGEYMNGPLSHLPQSDQEFLNAYEIKSIANIPLFVQDQFWGFFSVDDCRRERIFSEDEIDIMQSVSLMMANAINLHESSIKLESALMDAEQASNTKSRFLANMSHEMRTPLNAIIGLTDVALEDEELDEESLLNLEKIHSAGVTLLITVNDILDISKIESGKFELVPAVYDLPSLINDTVTQSIMHKGDKPIEFVLNIDANLPVQLFGDELRIKQILNNLLSNAFKYTRQGTIELGISNTCEGETVYVTAYVRDTGIGIHPESIGNIFADYAQMDTQTNRKIMGTGLGLSITKKMVELMNGTIEVESEYGENCMFTVRLPQKRVSDAVIGQKMVDNLKNCRYHVQKRKQQSQLPRIHLPYAHVLLVDDVQSNLDVARGLMKPYRMHIDCVTSGQQAIDVLRGGKVRYDAVFMDHMMPEMDGIEATHRIREIGTDYAQTIPIIALTANAIAGNEEMFLNKGFQAFIPKPIDLIQLDSVIRLFIRDKEKEKQHFNKQIIVDGNDVPDIRKGRERRVISLRRCGLDRRTLGKLYYDLNVKKGLKRFDGDKNVYMSVLRSFAVNTKPTLEKIKGVNKANLTDYVISVHGIKGSSRGIFAEVVGKQAEALEKAAKADDFDFVSENNPDFVKMVDALITDIETMLQKVDEHVAKPQKEKPDQETLTRLLEACKKYEMDGVDAAIEELERYEYESDGELVAGLRRSVDETDFAKIIETLSYLEK